MPERHDEGIVEKAKDLISNVLKHKNDADAPHTAGAESVAAAAAAAAAAQAKAQAQAQASIAAAQRTAAGAAEAHAAAAAAAAASRSMAPPAASTSAKSSGDVAPTQPSGSTGEGAAQVAGERFYRVKPGDSLIKIAEHFYGDGMQWRKIYDANRDKIANPDIIHPDENLLIPQ